MTETSDKGVALITGASSGIGAVYADRLARRGYDLILVARDEARLQALAGRLRAEAGVAVTVLRADLTVPDDLHRVEGVLAADPRLTLLVNNAGTAASGGLAQPDLDAQERLIQLNITAPTRLASAATPGFLARKRGTIVNIASAVAYRPELFPGIYGATKAYILALSQAQQAALGPQGVHVQAVLPAATRTEIWERSGMSVDALPAGSVMGVDDLVDAALVGLDRGETVTLPSLPDLAQWTAFETARLAMAQNLGNGAPALRYRAA